MRIQGSVVLVGLVALVLAALVSPAAADITIRGYNGVTAPLYDRYLNSSTFIGADYDWSGIGMSAGGQWGTMISPSYFLTATHYSPSGSLTFYPENTTSGAVTRSIASVTRIGTTDLSIGILSTPLLPADNITYYPILWGSSYADYLGLIVYNVGKPFRVGRNVVDDFQSVDYGGSTTMTMLYDYDNSDTPSVGGDETYVQGGDSGAPSFGVVGGFLGLTGIHWLQSSGGWVGSLDSFVPAYVSQIDAAMSDPLYLLSVPEPATALLLLGGCAVLACRPRRPSQGRRISC